MAEHDHPRLGRRLADRSAEPEGTSQIDVEQDDVRAPAGYRRGRPCRRDDLEVRLGIESYGQRVGERAFLVDDDGSDSHGPPRPSLSRLLAEQVLAGREDS